jgi:hypothetical protein
MAQFILKDAFVLINAVDLSDHVRSVTVNYSAEVQDNTPMTKNSRQRIGGLKDWSADVEFYQDHAAGEVDATLFGVVGSQIACEFRPTSAARGATNPGYTGNGIIESYEPVAGAVGENAMTRIRIVGSDGVPMARQTA